MTPCFHLFKSIAIFLTLLMIVGELNAKASFSERLNDLIRQDSPKWMLNQINEELVEYKKNGVTKDSLDRLMQVFGDGSVVRFKISGQTITLFTDINETSFLYGRLLSIHQSLKKLVKAAPLPDVDFILSLHDSSPLIFDTSLAPVFVMSKTKLVNNQIIIPNLCALTNYSGIGSKIRAANKGSPWSQKEPQAFWRGSTTGGSFGTNEWNQLARARLVLLSIQHPGHLDAKFTKFTQGAEVNPAMLSMPELIGSVTTPQDSLMYKYLIDVDGNTCSWERMYWVLLSNCTLFKQMSDNLEWYYTLLVPNVHFIPIKRDLCDLIKKINWAKTHDSEVKAVAKQGMKFAKKYLSEEMIYLYLYLTLVEYARLQNPIYTISNK